MSDLILPSRRGFLTGLGAVLITAPAIVRMASVMPIMPIMPVKALKLGTIIRIRLPNDYIVNNGPLLLIDAQRTYSYNATEIIDFASLMLRTPWIVPTELEEM